MHTMSYADRLQSALAEPDRHLLRGAASIAARLNRPLYLVGGPVRDCLLGRPIIDFDLTVEGDAIDLAQAIARELGGTLKTHERFGNGPPGPAGRSRTIDLAMTRTESYARPAALPDVLAGAIQDDMARRDFTLNAMGHPAGWRLLWGVDRSVSRRSRFAARLDPGVARAQFHRRSDAAVSGRALRAALRFHD